MPKWPGGNWRKLVNEQRRNKRMDQARKGTMRNKIWKQMKHLEFTTNKRIEKAKNREIANDFKSYMDREVEKAVRRKLAEIIPYLKCNEDKEILRRESVFFSEADYALDQVRDDKKRLEIVDFCLEVRREIEIEKKEISIRALKQRYFFSVLRKGHSKILSEKLVNYIQKRSVGTMLEVKSHLQTKIDGKLEKGGLYKFLYDHELYFEKYLNASTSERLYQKYRSEIDLESIDIIPVYDFDNKGYTYP